MAFIFWFWFWWLAEKNQGGSSNSGPNNNKFQIFPQVRWKVPGCSPWCSCLPWSVWEWSPYHFSQCPTRPWISGCLWCPFCQWRAFSSTPTSWWNFRTSLGSDLVYGCFWACWYTLPTGGTTPQKSTGKKVSHLPTRFLAQRENSTHSDPRY